MQSYSKEESFCNKETYTEANRSSNSNTGSYGRADSRTDNYTAITAEPSTTPAITATPATKVTVVNITKSDDTFTVTLTLDGTYTNEQLKGAKVTLTNSVAKVTTTATFSKIDVDGKAVFTVDDTKVLTPGDTTANGDYKVSSDSEALVISGNVVASYEESLAGNKFKGSVLTDKLNNGKYDGSFKNAVAGATFQ